MEKTTFPIFSVSCLSQRVSGDQSVFVAAICGLMRFSATWVAKAFSPSVVTLVSTNATPIPRRPASSAMGGRFDVTAIPLS